MIEHILRHLPVVVYPSLRVPAHSLKLILPLSGRPTKLGRANADIESRRDDGPRECTHLSTGRGADVAHESKGPEAHLLVRRGWSTGG